jgi:NAD(P)-dependent dehydrogenase (short-subunit alcohol dehydrogenase family)
MAKTVLITGSSAGIGRAAAIYFSKKGWNVIATMRHPEKEAELGNIQQIHLGKLDVIDIASIDRAIQTAIKDFKKIDVLINNAGYALTGPFEDATEEQINRQFNTNVFGLMRVTKAILPHFRENKGGIIINIASVGGRVAFPFYSLYHSTKWAVEGFSESLQHELRPFNIRVKIIEPGPIKTEFYSRSMDTSVVSKSPYEKLYQRAIDNMQAFIYRGGSAEQVAKKIYSAACSNSYKLRYPVGGGAGAILLLRKLMPDRIFNTVVQKVALRK